MLSYYYYYYYYEVQNSINILLTFYSVSMLPIRAMLVVDVGPVDSLTYPFAVLTTLPTSPPVSRAAPAMTIK